MDGHGRPKVFVIAVVMATLLTGCGEDARAPKGGDPSRPDPRSNAPASDPPTVDGAGEQPPSAWVEASPESSWMAYGSYCWGRACVDMVSPQTRDDLPTIEVEQGETVTFHLGFDPAEVTLTLPGSEKKQMSLPARRDVSWQVSRGGIATLFARPHKQGGDASYSVRVVVADSGGPP